MVLLESVTQYQMMRYFIFQHTLTYATAIISIFNIDHYFKTTSRFIYASHKNQVERD